MRTWKISFVRRMEGKFEGRWYFFFVNAESEEVAKSIGEIILDGKYEWMKVTLYREPAL